MGRALAAGLICFGLAAGVARGAIFRGTERADKIVGTPRPDSIDARGGNDRVTTAWDWQRDDVRCGAGLDLANVDPKDVVNADCEVVGLQLSRDTTTDRRAQHQTQVEPSSYAWGSTIVTAFQSGRFSDGGAAAIGWAASTDGGVHWRNGLVNTAPYDRVSDSVVAYDAVHKTWLIAALGAAPSVLDVAISRSRDGVTWSSWIPAVSEPAEDYDKEWLTCDNWSTSPYRGRCYLAYVDTTTFKLGLRWSADGGVTWSAVTDIAGVPQSAFSGPVPIVRPNGAIIIPFTLFGPLSGVDEIDALRSTDGGATWSAPYRISTLADEDSMDIRAPALPSAAVDSAGRVYVVWQDARYRDTSSVNDIVLATSADAVTWRDPSRLPLPAGTDAGYFLPAVAADPAVRGHIAVLFHSLGLPPSCALFVPGCEERIDVWLIESRDGGLMWSAPKRLNVESMLLPWLAETSLGAMLGDYVAVSFVRGRAVPVFALASARNGEAIFALSRG